MKYRALTLIVIVLLFISGINVIATNQEIEKDTKEVVNLSFINIKISQQENYTLVDFDNTNNLVIDVGKPVLPVYTKTYKFPFGTKIKSVECEIKSDIKKEFLNAKVKPAPQPVLLIDTKTSPDENIVEDYDVYADSSLYPSEWYDYKVGVGLDGDEHVVLLTVNYYPVRYSPLDNSLYYADDVDIKVSYDLPFSNDVSESYGLVVVAPKTFSIILSPLIKHKNNVGVKTLLKTTEDIYREYDGRDKPEQIKYFIKDAIEKWDVKYVLLVGGRKGQRLSWYLPVRYSNLEVIDWFFNETYYISDLYYADVYKYNQSSGEYEFDDWDSNKNGVFAEWNRNSSRKDIIDLYPDVHLGRLPCRNRYELFVTVRKIINYETKTYGDECYKQMIVGGGDTFTNPYDNDYEGEMEVNLSASYMSSSGFDIVKLLASDGTLKRQRDVIKAMNSGAGFVHFAGHGSSLVWSTHPPHNDTIWIDALLTFGGINLLRNRDRYPVVVVGGCHNSQFDVTSLNFFIGLREEGLGYFASWESGDMGSFAEDTWAPECWSSKLLAKRNGGGIAVIGNTGLGLNYPGNYTLKGLNGWINPRFFYNFARQSSNILGSVYSQTLNDYISLFDVDRDRSDCKTVEEWVLLGDPSLKIGGYS